MKDSADEWGFSNTGMQDKATREMCGFGQKIYRQGRIQEGFFYDGWFYGDTKVVYSTGAAYTGGWKDSKKHGKGKFYHADGTIAEGNWENGDRQGQFTVTDKKGKK